MYLNLTCCGLESFISFFLKSIIFFSCLICCIECPIQ
nr:MAG TPA: hypothetical protein [Caudoviricetes sp.]